MDSHASHAPSTAYRVYDEVLATSRPAAVPLTPVEAAPTLRLGRADAPLMAEDPAQPAIYETETLTGAGRPLLCLHRPGEDYVFRATDVADYLMHEGTIRYWPFTSEARVVDYVVIGIVLPMWLELGGQPVLHCSAIEVEGQALVFLAHPRTGKSSLAASFLKAGRRLITDDVMPLRLEGRTILGVPSFPLLRMWPDQAKRLLGDHGPLALIRSNTDKRWVPTNEFHGDAFWEQPLPVRAAYLLERSEEAAAGAGVRFEPMRKTDAVVSLIQHSFLGRAAEFAGLAAGRLEVFARFVDSVPMQRLTYPSGLDALPRVRKAILADLGVAAE